MFGGNLHDLRIGWQRRTAEVAENGLAVAVVHFVPPPQKNIVERLQPVLLAAGGHARPGATSFDHDGKFSQDLRVPVEDSSLAHHVDIGADRTTRHGKADNPGVRGCRDWIEVVVLHSFVQHFLDLVHLGVIDIKRITGAFESVPHGAHIGLDSSGSHGPYGEIDSVDAGFDSGHITGNRHRCRVVGVLPEDDFRRENFLEPLGRLIAGSGVGRSGRVLHAHRVEVRPSVEQLLNDADVEIGGVDRVVLEWKTHQ